MKITYQKTGGIHCSDADLEEVANKIVEEKNDVVVSSTLLIYQIRVLVKKGKINCKDIVFVFNGEDIEINNQGRLSEWPIGFCDVIDDLLMELVKF